MPTPAVEVPCASPVFAVQDPEQGAQMVRAAFPLPADQGHLNWQPGVASVGAGSSLVACGGGGSGAEGGNAAAQVPTPGQPLAANEASRFLGQAAFGGTAADVAALQSQGLDGWLSSQFAAARTQSHWDWMVANGYAVVANTFNFAGVDNTLWRKLMSSPDVLRQRVTLALSEIFVISMDGLPVAWRGMVAASYMDTLEAHAFGNYRQLLEAVTLSVGMGVYLNMRGNQKADGKGREPDENYAREVMQLFTIGLYKLNPDGTLQTVNGAPQDTYTQDDIKGLARVFTGWDYDRYNATVPDHAARPMVFTASRHSPEEKKFLGVTLPAGTDGVGELRAALDTLANHPNVGPFIGKQLIQRLVTSNPSAAYVGRVAAAFAKRAGCTWRPDGRRACRVAGCGRPHPQQQPGWRQAARTHGAAGAVGAHVQCHVARRAVERGQPVERIHTPGAKPVALAFGVQFFQAWLRAAWHGTGHSGADGP